VAVQKSDILILGQGGLTDNSQGSVLITANNAVAYWLNTTTYSQFNVVEYAGSMYRSKIFSNVGNQPSTSPSDWQVLYRNPKDGDFAFTIGSGATILQRELSVWTVFGNHPAISASYDEQIDFVASSPGPHQMVGPVFSGTNISLPPNSRTLFSTEFYTVGSGSLELFLNGDKLLVSDDYDEVGTDGSSSNQIQIERTLDIGDRLTFRQITFSNLTGYGGGGGGGSEGLQDAYNIGSTITTSIGNPFTVGGAATKVAQFNGNIGVTGLVDPTGITFIPQVSSPLGAFDGIWVNSAHQFIYTPNGGPDMNISAALSGGGAATTVQLKNLSGTTIPALSPVSLDSSTGGLKITNVTSESDANTFQGITSAAILNNTSGPVVVSGAIPNISTAIAVGSPIFLSKPSGFTSTEPDYGVGTFAAGDWIIKVGALAQNPTNPSQIDLIVNSDIRGRL
jgi:hypothetical protein